MTEDTLTPAVDQATLEETRLRAKVASLREELATAAAELEQLRVTLGAFEARYDARIGVLMVESDRVELEIAILRRRIAALEESADAWRALDERIEREFKAERARVEAESQAAAGATRRATELPPAPEPDVAAAIRTQYRKLARKFHPDVAADEDQRERNERVMRRLNGAMEMNDLGTLLDMELELPDVDQEMPGPTRGARIAWATAEIARLETALSRRVGELAALRASSGYDLWSRVEREPGILDRLEGELRTELAAAQMELHALARQHDDLVANVVRGGAS